MPSEAAPSPRFTPTAETAANIIDAITDPTHSLASLAAQHNTTIEALSAWMIRPDIRERLESLNSIAAWRTRLVASAHLDRVVGTLSSILDAFRERAKARRAASVSSPPPKSEVPDPQTELKTLCFQLRSEENARRSASLLLRLANLRPVAGHDQLAPALPRAPRPVLEPHAAPKPAPPAPPPAHAQHPSPAPRQSAPQPAQPSHRAPTPLPSAPSVPWVPPDLSPARTPRPGKRLEHAASPANLLAAATREHWP